jgi:DNA-binding NtrC family response regulator
MEHAFVMCREAEITPEHLPKEFREKMSPPEGLHEGSLRSHFKDSETEIIKAALKRNRGHRATTARELGINPSTLWRKMKRLGISED